MNRATALAVMLLAAWAAPAHASDVTPSCVAKPCFFVLMMHDDVSSLNFQGLHDVGEELFANASDPATPVAPNTGVDTPNLTRIVDAGMVVSGMTVSQVCTPTRWSIISGLDVGNYNHMYGAGRRADHDYSYWSANPAISTLPRTLEANGKSTYFAGKVHMSQDQISNPASGVAFIKQLGFTTANIVMLGNDDNPWNIDYTQGVLPGSVNVWDDCKGHNYGPVSTLDGAITFSTENTGKQIYDDAIEYIEAQTTGFHVLLVWDNITHAPNRPGAGAIGSCNYSDHGATEDQHDWPPGYSFTAGDDEGDVWLASLEYLDVQKGLLIDAIETHDGQVISSSSDSVVCSMTDNGTAQAMAPNIHSAECSTGFVKKSAYPCGIRSALVCAGRGVENGVMLPDQMFHASDLMPTILAAHGIADPRPKTSKSMWNCMTSLNGETAANCSVSRSHISYQRWFPTGGNATGTIAERPDPENDDANEWDIVTFGEWFYHTDGIRYYVQRDYTDTTVSPYKCVLTLAYSDDDGTAANRYGTVLAAGVELADCVITTTDGADWTDPPTADQLSAIQFGMALIDKQGPPPPTNY